MSETTVRILIRQPALPMYRLAIFQELANRPDIEMRLLYASNPSIPNVSPAGLNADLSELQVNRMPVLGEYYRDPELFAEIKSYRPDVVLSWWNVRQSDLGAMMRFARNRRIGSVLWGHGYSKAEVWWRRHLRDRLARSADAVVTYNRRARHQITSRGIAEQKVFVAPNALDQSANREAAAYWKQHPSELEAFRLAAGIGPGPVIGFVSRMDPMIRLDLLVAALPHVREFIPGCQVVIVGRGDEEKKKLKLQSHSLGVSDAVVFVGAEYDPMRIGAYFTLFDVFCYPSNIGLSILHAFGFGVPVITCDDLDLQNPEIEALEDGENGLLYRAGDSEALAISLTRLLSDKVLRDRMGRNAFRSVTELYSSDPDGGRS